MRSRPVDIVAGVLSAAISAVLRVRDQMKADGASRAELDACVEQVVREVWPRGREEPWKYACPNCSDTGLRMHVCTPWQRCDGISTRMDSPHGTVGKYKRLCAQGVTTYEHDCGMPCWCPLGRRFQSKPSGGEDDFTTSTKSKPKPMQRWGR